MTNRVLFILQESGVHEHVKTAVRTSVDYAIELDRTYELRQKAFAAAQAAYAKAVEWDREYEIHQKVGAAVAIGARAAVAAGRAWAATPGPSDVSAANQTAPKSSTSDSDSRSS